MGENPSHFEGPSRPVENVSWEDAQAFCARLGERVAGLLPRLPTEAEWEYACRAGTTGARWSEDLDAIAWHVGNSGRQTHPVGEKAANPWGLHDTLGNVWEWCADHSEYSPPPYGDSELLDPVVTTGPKRVIRGGSWADQARDVRAACRIALHPGIFGGSDLGFRLAAGPALSGEAAPSKSKRAGDQPPDGGADAPESSP